MSHPDVNRPDARPDQHGELWEDFYDALALDERRNEPRESFEAVEERLVRDGKLRG